MRLWSGDTESGDTVVMVSGANNRYKCRMTQQTFIQRRRQIEMLFSFPVLASGPLCVYAVEHTLLLYILLNHMLDFLCQYHPLSVDEPE